MKKMIIHACTVHLDGLGDLLHFLNWLRLVYPFLEDNDNRIIIKACDIPKVMGYINKLKALEPEHPIFKIMEKNKARILPHKLALPNQKSQRSDENYFPRVNKIFPDIEVNLENSDNLAIFYISLKQFELLKQVPDKQIEKVIPSQRDELRFLLAGDPEFIIGELGSIQKVIDQEDKPTALGIGPSELGILFDETMPRGNEDLQSTWNNIPERLRVRIFSDITYENIKDNFFVYLYIAENLSQNALNSVLYAKIVIDAINKKIKPTIIIVNPKKVELPKNLLLAEKQQKLRIIRYEWIDRPEHKVLMQFLYNSEVKSLIFPSGDNTLFEAIYAGVFPVFNHRYYGNSENPNNKTRFFAHLSQLLNSDSFTADVKLHPGFKDCQGFFSIYNESLVISSKDFESFINSEEFYTRRAIFITDDAVACFRDKIAPYLREYFDFKSKALPALLAELANSGYIVKEARLPELGRLRIQ